MSKVQEIKANIEKIQKSIDSPATPEFSKSKLKDKLESLKKDLANAEKESTKSDTKPAKKAAPKAKAKASKPAAAKPAEKKKPAEDSITVQGITITKSGCPQGYQAFKDYKNRKKKSAKKSDAKPDGDKGKSSFEHAISHVFDAVPAAKIKKDPKEVKSAMKSFKTKMDKAFDELDGILSASNVSRLKKALKVIDKILEEIPEK